MASKDSNALLRNARLQTNMYSGPGSCWIVRTDELCCGKRLPMAKLHFFYRPLSSSLTHLTFCSPLKTQCDIDHSLGGHLIPIITS